MSHVSATMTNCPDEETLAAFLDGRLKQDARNELIEHIAGCAECRDVTAAARELESENLLEAGNVREFPTRRRYIPAAVAAAIAASMMVVAFVPEVRDWVSLRIRSPLAPVKTAYESGTQRTVESRLSGFPYKKLKDRMRGAGDEGTGDDDLLPMKIAAADLEETASTDSWKKQHALALAHLLIGERDAALRAIELAERAGGDKDAGFLNDAAAVYLERADNSGQAEDRIRAFKAAERAWARAKTPESAWNRALAHEMIGSAEAARAWKEYLAIDAARSPASDWQAEAQDHLLRLQENPPQP